MDLEKLVQIADSQGISVDQLIRQTRESYARFIGKKDMVRLKSLRKSTGIDPSDDLVQEVYGAYLSKGWIGLLKSLYNATGIRPSLPEEDVQQWYATYLDKRQLDKLKSLHDVTDVRPSLPEESVQQEYVDCLGEGRMDDLIILHAVTGIDPAKEVIQDIYAVLMRRRSFDNLKSLIEKTGIKVSLPDEIIQNKYFGYYNCLKSTSVIDSVDMMNQLHELTGVAPLEHTVQVAYAGFILKGDSELSCISKLHSATDINVSEETVQEGYALYAREVRLGDIKRLRSATKVKPVFRDEDVQEGYKLCLERQCMSKMESFRESTGI